MQDVAQNLGFIVPWLKNREPFLLVSGGLAWDHVFPAPVTMHFDIFLQSVELASPAFAHHLLVLAIRCICCMCCI
jgi:hypothetical protein